MDAVIMWFPREGGEQEVEEEEEEETCGDTVGQEAEGGEEEEQIREVGCDLIDLIPVSDLIMVAAGVFSTDARLEEGRDKS